MSAQANHTTWTAYLSESYGTVAAGRVLCLNEDGSRYVISTTANRALQTLGSVGVAITAGDSRNRAVELQFCGMVPNSITGLDEGAAGPVRVSTTGTLERIADPDSSDEIVGKCDTAGNALVNFATQSEILAGGQPPGGSDKELQWNDDGAFNGLPWTYEGEDEDGIAELRAPVLGTETVTRWFEGNPISVWSHYSWDEDTVFGDYDVLTIGADAANSAVSMPNVLRTFGRSVQIMQAGRTDDTNYAAIFLARPIGTSTGTGTGVFPNFALFSTAIDDISATDDFGTGKGVLALKEAATEPTTNPALGVVVWNKPSDGEVYYRKTDGTIRPMALVGEWSQVSNSRINATTTGYLSWGTAGDTFPADGLIRMSNDIDGSPANVITWNPEGDDIALVRAYLRGGITELHLGGSEPDPTYVVDECYFHGERMFFRNAARMTWQLDSIVTNQNGILDFIILDRVITTGATPTQMWESDLGEPDSVTTYKAVIQAKSADETEGAAYEMMATFRNDSGVVTQIGTTTYTVTHEDDGAWDAAFSLTVGSVVQIEVTGQAATNITWTGRVWVAVTT